MMPLKTATQAAPLDEDVDAEPFVSAHPRRVLDPDVRRGEGKGLPIHFEGGPGGTCWDLLPSNSGLGYRSRLVELIDEVSRLGGRCRQTDLNPPLWPLCPLWPFWRLRPPWPFDCTPFRCCANLGPPRSMFLTNLLDRRHALPRVAHPASDGIEGCSRD